MTQQLSRTSRSESHALDSEGHVLCDCCIKFCLLFINVLGGEM